MRATLGWAALALAWAGQASALGPPDVRYDRQGERLPAGAVARFGSVRLWHHGGSGRLAFSPDGQRLASLAGVGRGQLEVRLWRVADGAIERTWRLEGWVGGGMVYCPDGRAVAIVGSSRIRILDLASGRITRQFGVLFQTIECIAFSPDGTTLVAGCDGDSKVWSSLICRWDLRTGKRLDSLSGHRRRVECLGFSSDGKRLISASSSIPWVRDRGFESEVLHENPGNVCVWEMPSGKRLKDYPLSGQHPRLSPDGRLLGAAISGRMRVKVIETATGQPWGLLHEQPLIYGLAFLPDGKTAATSGYRTGPIQLRDVRSGQVRRSLSGLLGVTTNLLVSPDGRTIAVGRGGAVRLWDVPTGRELRPVGGHTDAVERLAISADGRTLISGGHDGRAIAWDVRSGKELGTFSDHGREVTAVGLSPDGRSALSGDAASVLHIWQTDTGRRLHGSGARPEPKRGRASLSDFFSPSSTQLGVVAALVTPDGRRVLDARADGAGVNLDGGSLQSGTLSYRALATGKAVRELACVEEAPVALTADGRMGLFEALVDAGGQSELRLRRLPSQALVARIIGKPRAGKGDDGIEHHFKDIVLSPCGRLVAANVAERRPERFGPGSPREKKPVLHVWEAVSGGELLRFAAARPLASSPGAGLLACRSDELGRSAQVDLYDATTGRRLTTLKGHLAEVSCAVFAPDGRRLYTGSEDRTVLAWDIAPFLTPAPPAGPLTAAEFDRHWLALASGDAKAATTAVRRLAARPAEAVAMLRGRLRPIAAVPAAVVAAHVRDLSQDALGTRHRAERALLALGERAEPALVRAWEGPDPETSLRAGRLLRLLGERPEPDALRAVRAVTALERMGTPEARRLLAALAKGAPGARLTVEASLALRRLEARP